MKIRETIRQQPQPFAAVWAATLVSFIPFGIAVVNQPESHAWPMLLLSLPTPILFGVMGLILALNVRDNAARMSELSLQSRGSSASPGFMRFVGAFVLVGSVWMTILFATGNG